MTGSLSALLSLNRRNQTIPHSLAQDILNQISAVPSRTVLIWIHVGMSAYRKLKWQSPQQKEALLLPPQREQLLLATDLILDIKKQLNTGSACRIFLTTN